MREELIRYKIRLTIDSAKRLVDSLYYLKADIDITQGRYIVNAKSILGILSLDLTQDMVIEMYSTDINDIIIFENVVKDITIK